MKCIRLPLDGVIKLQSNKVFFFLPVPVCPVLCRQTGRRENVSSFDHSSQVPGPGDCHTTNTENYQHPDRQAWSLGKLCTKVRRFWGVAKYFCAEMLWWFDIWSEVSMVFFKQSNRKRVKWMCQCLIWVNAREVVLLEQWKTGWVSCDFQLGYKSVTEFILTFPALLFIWKIIFKIKCFLTTSFLFGILCDSSLNHHSLICFLSCQTLNKQTSFWVTGRCEICNSNFKVKAVLPD